MNINTKEKNQIIEISDLMSEKLLPLVSGLKEVSCIFKWSKVEGEGFACGVQVMDDQEEIVGFTIVQSPTLEEMKKEILEEIRKEELKNKPDSYYDQQIAVKVVGDIINKTLH